METQTPATLPSSDKKEILVVKFQCVEDRAPQFRVPPKVRELTPSFLLFEVNSKTTEHYLLWEESSHLDTLPLIHKSLST